jgi:NAD(P)-dependent dehydrogenase (short-subunit alcohol dehydrogenase family)
MNHEESSSFIMLCWSCVINLRQKQRANNDDSVLQVQHFKMDLMPRSYNSSALIRIICLLVAILAIWTSDTNVDILKTLPSLAKDKTILVTGANSGLGLATVKLLAQAGTCHKIILACRHNLKCQQAQIQVQDELPEMSDTQIVTVRLDLANQTSIQEGALAIQDILLRPNDNGNQMTKVPSLDVLINNAGVMGAWTSKEYVEGVETHMSINHLSHVLLTHCLWKNLLASSRMPRIVHISSLTAMASWRDVTFGWYNESIQAKDRAGAIDHPIFNTIKAIQYYAQSKRANLMFAAELHQRYNDQISSTASHPGYTRSNLMMAWQFEIFPSAFKKFVQNNRILSMSTKDGAKTQIMAALSPAVTSGSLVVPRFWVLGRPMVSTSLYTGFSTHFWPFSRSESSRLWEESMNALNISEFGKLE